MEQNYVTVTLCISYKLTSAYVKCMKLFFGIPKYGSVSAMLMQLNLPSFNTVLHNARVTLHFTAG